MADPERTNLPIDSLHAQWLIRHEIDPLDEWDILQCNPITAKHIAQQRALDQANHKRGVSRSDRKKGR